MTGLLCSQPPDGVAETTLPQRSTTSTWQVSPETWPRPARVGSPTPGGRPSTLDTGSGSRGARPSGEPGRSSSEAVAPISARRAAAYAGSSSAASGTSVSPYHASRSAKASLPPSITRWAKSGPTGSSAPRS